jgi:hypothetical protein
MGYSGRSILSTVVAYNLSAALRQESDTEQVTESWSEFPCLSIIARKTNVLTDQEALATDLAN